MSITVLDAILQSIRDAAAYNKHELAPPRVILWPDEERLWTQCIESLREAYPALWTLGDFSTENVAGPAAWLRYQLETYAGADLPVIYLPGVGRSAFRSAEQCPKSVSHLFALQFQGQFWTQKNGKSWTPFAYLSSAIGGLGLDVAPDQETKKAIQECLPALLNVEVVALRVGKREAGDFRAIVTRDPARTLLRWMSDPITIKAGLVKAGAEWTSFCAICRDEYRFDPETDGAITAGEKLSSRTPAWELVWERFREAPRAYPGVIDLLKSQLQRRLFEERSEYKPQSNRTEEEHLESDLLALSGASPTDARAKIRALAIEHAPRTTWVWATLGESPLALASMHLRELVDVIDATGNPGTWEVLADYYATVGWKADRAVLRALDAARTAAATKAVTSAIRTVYLPWIEKLSVHAQALASSYPTTGLTTCRTFPVEEGTVYVFADGLRLDLAKSLEEKMLATNLAINVVFDCEWSALPTVTATAKPAWLPLAEKLGGPLEGASFQAKERSSGTALVQARFKQLLADLGITFLESDSLELPTGCAWTELGSFDAFGHSQGAKLAWRVDEELAGLRQRIVDLVQAGWAKVKVVTDHGWLLAPGGLPKADLPKHLVASRWSRCAVPEPGARHGYPVASWFWDSAEAVVLAPNVSCFMVGMEYAHGGLTLQEALVPSLTISAKKTDHAMGVVLKDLKWAGMRLNLVLEGAQGLTVDVRRKVADPTTSFVANPVTGAADGQRTSLLVADDDAVGAAAFLVVVDRSGQCIFKHAVVIGED